MMKTQTRKQKVKSLVGINQRKYIKFSAENIGVVTRFLYKDEDEDEEDEDERPTIAQIAFLCTPKNKPGEVNRIQLGSVTKCFYPSDSSIILGSFSIICLAISSCFGVKSIFFSYNGKTIPTHALWRSTTLVAFFILSILLSILATSFLMWATITEGVHRHRSVHTDPVGKCPTAKTGLFGGAGFLALDACLFWLICQMLTMNAREDYEDDEDTKGEYGKVSDVDYVSTADIPVNSKV